MLKFSSLADGYRHYSQPCVSMEYCFVYSFWMVLSPASGNLTHMWWEVLSLILRAKFLHISGVLSSSLFCPENFNHLGFPGLSALSQALQPKQPASLCLGSFFLPHSLENSPKAVNQGNHRAHLICFPSHRGHYLSLFHIFCPFLIASGRRVVLALISVV